MPWHEREHLLWSTPIYELETCYYHIKPSRPEFPSDLKQKLRQKAQSGLGKLRVIKNVNEFGNLHLIS